MIGTVILFTALLSIAFVVSLAAKPKVVAAITFSMLFVSIFGGILIYGYGYGHDCLLQDMPMAVLKAAISAIGMLLGRNDWADVADAPFFQSGFGTFVFWLLHVLGMYAAAGTAAATVGASLLRRFRLWLSRWNDVVLIYGIHTVSLEFGQELLARKRTSVVFVDEEPSETLVKEIHAMGGVDRSDAHALAADRRFVKSMGIRPGKRKIWLYVMAKENTKNLCYADAFKKALEAEKILPEQTSLVLIGAEEGVQTSFVAKEGRYGYGNLDIIDKAQLAARRLIRQYPPAKALTFDEKGKATQDLDCMIFGFGRIGQAVLQQVTINGQFYGSTFHAAVFDPKCAELTGCVRVQNKCLLDDYDIRFVNCDARSKEMYEYLESHKDTLNYAVVCTGSDKINEEIADELLRHFARRGKNLPVYTCSYSGVQRISFDSVPKKWKLYCADLLWQNGMDIMAMAVNQIYCQGNGKTMQKNWESCDYFSRMSSRAFADFIPSMLHMAGQTLEGVPADWKPEGELLENLAITEHMRWCAFHYSMGYTPMTPEEFHTRGRQHAKEREETGKGKLRIGKDTLRRVHACLTPWEKLDELSQAENSYTGKNLDYKDMDRNNVLAMPQILAIAREAEELL